jgi:alpha-ketoglutarate-dependent taurine dioxygenase
VTLSDWLDERAGEIGGVLGSHGVILFRGFVLHGGQNLEEVVNVVSGPAMDYPGNIQTVIRRTQVAQHIATSTEYSADMELRAHSECAFAVAWPLHIYFYCEQAAEWGGATPIMSNRGVYDCLDPGIRAEFERRGVMYLRNFGFGSTRSWQDTFETEDRSVVEARCHAEGVTPEWIGKHGLRTRSVRPALANHVISGERLWFNHVNSTHITVNTPDLLAAFRRTFAPDELPRHCLFGDGAEISDDIAAEVRRVCDTQTLRFDWQSGDVLLLDNMRYGHGRDPYQGERRVLVGMARRVQAETPGSLATRVKLA